MFSSQPDPFHLKRALQDATRQYDDYLVRTDNPDDLIASCAYGNITDAETDAIISLKIGAPELVLEAFRIFFAEKEISYRSEGNYLIVNHAEYQAKKLTVADEKILQDSIRALLLPDVHDNDEKRPSPC